MEQVTIPALHAMKGAGRKIAGIVAWDTQLAQLADAAGIDIVSVGDSVGVNLWGRDDPLDVTLDEMLVVCKAVRHGVTLRAPPSKSTVCRPSLVVGSGASTNSSPPAASSAAPPYAASSDSAECRSPSRS